MFSVSVLADECVGQWYTVPQQGLPHHHMANRQITQMTPKNEEEKEEKKYIFMCQTNRYRLEHEMIKRNMVYWRVAAAAVVATVAVTAAILHCGQFIKWWMNAMRCMLTHHEFERVLWRALMTMGTKRQDISTSMRAHSDKNGCLSKKLLLLWLAKCHDRHKNSQRKKKKRKFMRIKIFGSFSTFDHVRGGSVAWVSRDNKNDASKKK